MQRHWSHHPNQKVVSPRVDEKRRQQASRKKPGIYLLGGFHPFNGHLFQGAKRAAPRHHPKKRGALDPNEA